MSDLQETSGGEVLGSADSSVEAGKGKEVEEAIIDSDEFRPVNKIQTPNIGSHSSSISNSPVPVRIIPPPNGEDSDDSANTEAARPKFPIDEKGSPEASKSAKEMGNEAFKKGDYEGAVDHWFRALRSCKYVLSKSAYEGAQKEEIEEMLKVAQLNLAAGYLKLGRFGDALRYTEEVLNKDPKNVKALYRRADAYFNQGEYPNATKVLDELLTVEPGSSAAKALKERAARLHAKYTNKEKKMMKGLFEGIEPDPRTQPDESNFLNSAWNQLSVFFRKVKRRVQHTMTKCCQKRRPLPPPLKSSKYHKE